MVSRHPDAAERRAANAAAERRAAHEAAVAHAEARHLVLALAPFGVLDRSLLVRECGCAHWTDGTFDRALETAIAEGAIEELPGGFYRTVH